MKHHALVLVDGGVEHPRTPWLARCSCGTWASRPTRRRRDAARQYRRHQAVVGRLNAKRAGIRPRRPTPVSLLPVDLQPRTVSFS